MQAFLLYMDPEGNNLCTGSQHWTSQFAVSQSAPTVSGLKAKIAELQKQLAVLEVNIIILSACSIRCRYWINLHAEYCREYMNSIQPE